MAQVQVCALTQTELNDIESALNRYLGNSYFKTSTLVPADFGDITSVVVDMTEFMKEETTGNGAVNADKLIQKIQALPSADQDDINTRYGENLVSWLQANCDDRLNYTWVGLND